MLANIIRNRKKTAIGGGGGGIVIDNGDPYYSAVSLLLPMDGTNGSTAFTDSGPNALTITPTGTTISTSQAKYGASGYFNGTSAYLTAASSAITLGTSDFTIEFWVYPLDVRTFSLYDSRTNETNPNGNGFVIGTSASQAWVVYQAANRIVGPTVVANQWTHVAVTRSGSSVKMWINGVQVGSTWTTTGSFSDGATLIGTDYPKNARFVYGYIDDFRISQFARYVSTFTPPTAALPTTASSTPADPYYGYTSLLLHMDGSSGSTNFVDSGPSALTVTASGDAQISTAQSKYGSASGYLDGTGDFLTIANSSLFAFGTGDFTIEFWIKTTDNAGGIAQVTGGTTGYWQLSLFNGNFYWQTARNTTNAIIYSAASILDNNWHFVSVTRLSGTTRLAVDGTVVASVADSTNYSGIAGSLIIGRDASNSDLLAYFDDIRITKGYARSIAPPTQAHLEYANGNDRHFSNVSLLLHMDGANGSTTFTDNSSNALTITRTGTPAISTAQSVLGGASASFDGTGQYLSPSSSTGMLFATGDFTVEFWFYANSLSSTAYSCLMGFHNGGSEDWGVFVRSNGVWIYGGGVYLVGGGTVSTGTWYHFAASRSGSTIRVFLNGTQVGISTSATGNYTNNAGNAFRIGDDHTATNPSFNGLIDDLRITKGVSRYSANFTPPTSAHPNA